jgi:hypothetical protein
VIPLSSVGTGPTNLGNFCRLHFLIFETLQGTMFLNIKSRILILAAVSKIEVNKGSIHIDARDMAVNCELGEKISSNCGICQGELHSYSI